MKGDRAAYYWLVLLAVLIILLSFGWKNVPSGISTAPKLIVVDGTTYVACEGFIKVYQPSREIADSSRKTYEITFTDEYGRTRDARGVKDYTIRQPEEGQTLNYAMPSFANPSNTTTTFSDGQPFHPGNVVVWGNNGDEGRAKWLGPGKWEPVPCAFVR
jgi:hypothetical protein